MTKKPKSKFAMYVELENFIYAGAGVANMIYDSPFQNRDYAPYVVVELLKKTPLSHIPGAVLSQLRDELLEESGEIPKRKWYHRFWSPK